MKMYWTFILLPALLGVGLANPVPPEDTITTQENFQLPKIYGKWYDIGIASTCKYLKRHKEHFVMGTMELSEVESSEDVSTVHTRMRKGTCTQFSGSYQITDVPGKFLYVFPLKGLEFQTYIVHTNYDEYVIMLMVKTKNGVTTKTVKLYGRTPELRPSLIEDFRQFALEQGVPEDSIFTTINEGECVPGDIRVIRKRAVLNDEPEGSGDEQTPFIKNKGDSCRLSTESGPCLGMIIRYFYNTSSMACETFQYGGCLGNSNNFPSEKECLQTCRTEAACRLPIITGQCRMSKTLWAFDSVQGKCTTFQYGGCEGNGNQFYSEKECKEYCGWMKTFLFNLNEKHSFEDGPGWSCHRWGISV
ncbi:protein AMBP [Pelodytes ibericus]